ncbi:MAG: LLM class flavin-dependent oxidoreductase [Dehalococcoidia bacterium]
MDKTPVKLTAIANYWGPSPTGGDLPRATTVVAERARAIEAAGFDAISYAEFLEGDVFPPLMEIARATERVELMTRVAGAFSRSPVLLASGAAWVDEVARGRFRLGIGAAVPHESAEYLGIPFDRPAARMRDTVTIIRALWGEDLPGVERLADGRVRYPGSVIPVETARIDLVPQRPVPIFLAAAGPLMLQLAGELAAGVVLELTTPRFVEWAWEQIRIGAARTGRDLTGFEMCVQSSWINDTTATGRIDNRARQFHFTITHAIDKEFHPAWERGGLAEEARAVREAALGGDWAEAERLTETLLWPKYAVRTSDLDSFWRWVDGHVAAGVTMLALPANVETLFGISLAAVKERVATASQTVR